MATAYVMCGWSAAGKTTWVYKNLPRAAIMPSIHYRRPYRHLFDAAYGWLIQNCLREGHDIIIDEHNTKQGDRLHTMDLLDKIAPKDTKRVCVWIKVPLEKVLRRQSTRYDLTPVEMYIKDGDGATNPTMDEGWDEIIEVEYEPREIDAYIETKIPVQLQCPCGRKYVTYAEFDREEWWCKICKTHNEIDEAWAKLKEK